MIEIKASRSGVIYGSRSVSSVQFNFKLTIPPIRLCYSENKQKRYSTNEDTGSIWMQQFGLSVLSPLGSDYKEDQRSEQCR